MQRLSLSLPIPCARADRRLGVRSPLTFSITQRDAVRRRCPMPAAGPARR